MTNLVFNQLLILLVGLLFVCLVDPVCGRSQGRVEIYELASDGNKTRYLRKYAGSLLPGKTQAENVDACTAYCGTHQYTHAGVDTSTTDYDCFCGNSQSTPCGSEPCLSSFDATGMSPDLSGMGTSFELFTSNSLPTMTLSNINNYAVHVNQRVSFFGNGENSLRVRFVELGPQNVSVEVNSFWGAQSAPKEVNVYAELKTQISCPLGVLQGTTYDCIFSITSGSDVTNAKIKEDGSILEDITDVADPMYYQVGGNMKPDRFNVYAESFGRADKHKSLFINLNHEFAADSVIQAFEAYVTYLDGSSCMDWLIVEPTCGEGYVYCNALKECLAETETWCGSPTDFTTFNAPSDAGVFCSDAERFTITDNYTCPSLRSQEKPKAHYKIVEKRKTCTTRLGNIVWKLGTSISVKAGQILGWMPSTDSPLDVGFYSLDVTFDDPRPEYQYAEVYNVEIGTVLSDSYPLTSCRPIMHMVAAHVFAPSVYTHTYTAGTVGTTSSIEFEASSSTVGTTDSSSFPVQILDNISGLKGTLSNYDLYINEQTTLTMQVDTGSDYINYYVHWDNENFNGTYEEHHTTSISTTSHSYTVPGEYLINVYAENHISNMSIQVLVTVRGIINSVVFDDPERLIPPVPTSTPQLVDAIADGDGLAYVNFSATEHSGTEHSFSLYVYLSNYFYIHTEYTYDTHQDVLNVIKVGHPLNEQNYLAAYGSVEDIIAPLVIIEPPVVATNASYDYSVNTHVGTNVTYRWTWEDGDISYSNGTYDLREMAHIYRHFGNYTVELFCWNQVSNGTVTFDLTIQDLIVGPEFTADNFDSGFQEITNVSFMLEQGTGVNIHVDFGYNNIKSPVAFDMDTVGNSLYGRAAYLYPERGQYNVTVVVENDVSSKSITSLVSIQVPIEGFEVTLVQEQEGTRKLDYLEQGERLSIITKIDQGDDVTYYYDCGDGRAEIITEDTAINVTYPVWRTDPPYTLTVIAANLISNFSISIPVTVEMPVQELVGFEVFNDVENSTEEMLMQLRIEGGDFFNCSWNMSDGSETQDKYIVYQDFLDNNGTIFHQFEAGVYNVTLFCVNRLWEFETYTMAYSYDPVSLFDVDILRACPGEEFMEGASDFGNVYPIECPVLFAISNQKGTNVSYAFDYGYFDKEGDAVTSITYGTNETYHKFEFTVPNNVQRYTVGILAYSPVNQVFREFNIELVESIMNVSLKFAEEPVRIGSLANFTISVKGKPYKPCYTLDFGDREEKGTKYQTILFGHKECTTKEKYKFTIYMAGFEEIEPDLYHALISYLYLDINVYSAILTGENVVSTFTLEFPAKIFDQPCEPPELQWDSAIAASWEKAEEKSGFFKCRRYTILTKARKNCVKTLTFIERSWGLKQVEWNNDTQSFETLATIDIPGNDTRYVIEPRQLDYGLYMIQFNASMLDTVKDRFVLETESSISGFFVIKKCDLNAKIEGGTGKAVGQNGTIFINASQSTDPDMEPGTDMGLVFEWFCKQNNKDDDDRMESFPEDLNDCDPVTYPDNPDIATTNKSLPRDHFKGCFGTGIGKLAGSGHSGPILYLDTDFMLFSQSYDIWMKLSQPGREKFELIKYSLRVVFGVPPLVSIECKLNCEKKQNPTQKTSFVAKCTNCNGVVPIYSWQMFGKATHAGPDEPYEDETELLRKSASVDIDRSKNLVINPNTFVLGRDYLVKLSVYWDEDSYDTGGFSQYAIKINEPPRKGPYAGCFPNEMKGKALETKFQLVCDDIDDVDKPLTYYWYFLPGNSTTDWREATFPRQGLALSEQFTLSAGNPDNDDLVQLKVVVKDLFGAAMDPIFLEIKVLPKKLDTAAIDAMLGDENAMSDPAVMGNVMNGLLDSLKAPPPSDDTESEKAEVVDAAAVKEKMVAMLSNVKIDSPSGCSMVAGTLNGASEPGQEVSDDTLEKSLKATGNVAGFAGELSAEDLADISKNALSATSKFTSVLSGDNAADNIKNAMDSEAQLTSGSASSMVAGEIPTPIETANGVTKVLCIDPKAGSEDLGGFALPDMSEEGDESDCTGATNPVGKNRYGFDKSASAVHGGTMGLGLSSGPGKKKKVENLTEPIRLVLPNKEEIPPPESYLAYCELMRTVHLVECKVNSSNLFMKLSPWYNNFTGNFFLFMNKGTSPSLVDHQHNCTLPHPYPDNFVNMTKAQQRHFEEEERWRCFITQTAMNETCTGRWCVGVIYYTNTTNRTTELQPRDYPVEEAKCKSLNYTFYAYTRACLYWDEKKKGFSGQGCKASAETKDNETVCYCNHLTDFGGGGPLAEPQPIDFGAALSGFSNIGDNPTVFSVVMALIAVYIVGMIWARWMDKKDTLKNAMYPLDDNHPNDGMFYEISVHTGFKSGSTTTSNVFIILHGTLGETSPRQLYNPERKGFTQSGVDNFLMAVPYSLGELKSIEIWHNNTGESPGWFHLQTVVRDMETMKRYTFFNNQWLDVGEEDGLISRKVEKSAKSDLKDFNFVFQQTARQNLYDGHIWLSIFTRPATSTFTRCQRVSTCFSLLLTTMLANAMFYTGEDEPPTASIKMGPFLISINMIKTGITSSLIVVPCNLLIVLLFKKAGPKIEKSVDSEDPLGGSISNSKTPISSSGINFDEKSAVNINNLEAAEEDDSTKKHNDRVNFLKSLCFAGREDDDEESLRKKKKPLPHWLIYIGYFIVFVSCAVSAFFVILYGFSFGKPKSDKWIVAMMISFLQSVFAIQPVKIVVLSVMFALLMKDPSRDDDDNPLVQKAKKKRDSDAEDSELEEEAENITKKKKKNQEFKLPDERKLEEARQARLAEKRIKTIIKEIIVHLMFVTLCLMVAYAASDPYSFHLSEATKKLCMQNGITNSYFDAKAYAEELEDGTFRTVNDAEGVTTRLEWLDWARYSVIEYLFPIGWYNGDKDYLKGFTADTEASKVLAMARFRQLRVKPMSCQKHPVFEYLVEQCNAGYSWGVEDQKHYAPGWKPELNKTMRYRARRGKRKALYLGLETPWRYGESAELQAFPFVGKHATYSGSSYSVSIGPTKRIAKKIWQNMKDNFWVDRYTRAIITEANIYNANTNLMLIVTFLHEILPTGGWSFYYNIQSLRLYRYVGGLGDMIMLFDIIYIFVTLAGWYKVVKGSYKQGFKVYIKNPWQLLHLIVTFCSTGAIVCTMGRFLFVKWAVEMYMSEPELFVSFAYVGQLEYLIMGFIGFVVFFTNLEFLRILRFNRRVGLLTKTVGILGPPMASFAVLFMVVFMAYVGFCHCIYADKLFGYSSFMLTFISLTEMFLGSFDIFELIDQAPFFGPIMFFSYMLLIQMVLINMFIGIICDAFAAVREASGEEEETNVLSFMANRMKNLTGNDSGPMAPIYADWKTDWEVMMEDFEERCENCIYAMRNIESEEIRHDKWLSKADEKKKNVLAGVVGMEYFLYETEILDALQVLDRKTKRMTDEDSSEFLQAAAKKYRDEKNDEPDSDEESEDETETESESEEEESGEESE